MVVYDKTEWIKEYVDPFVVVTCTYSGNQKKIFAQKGNVLIDDRQENIDAWEKKVELVSFIRMQEILLNELKKLRSPLKLVKGEF